MPRSKRSVTECLPLHQHPSWVHEPLKRASVRARARSLCVVRGTNSIWVCGCCRAERVFYNRCQNLLRSKRRLDILPARDGRAPSSARKRESLDRHLSTLPKHKHIPPIMPHRSVRFKG